MSRKGESKAKDAIVTVNIDDFTRTRDSVIVSLATLQSAVSDLSRAYINHANTVLNRGPVAVENSLTSGLAGGFASSLLENGLLSGVAQHAFPQEQKVDPGEKKKRKRAPPDPNAPKRALTPFFLYMQHNRPVIASELGPDAKKKEVADEGAARWARMGEEEKEIWKRLYNDNLAVYRAKMKAYKEGLPAGQDDNAKADNQLQESVAAAEAEADEETQSSDDEDEEDEEEEVAREPTPPPSKRRRGGAAKPTPASPVSNKKASPEKKKQQQPPQATPAKKDVKETPSRKPASSDPKRKSKKRKSEGGADE